MAIYFPQQYEDDRPRAYSGHTDALDGVTEMSFFISFQMPTLKDDARQYIWKFGDNSNLDQISLRTDESPNNKKLNWSFTASDISGNPASANAISDDEISENTTYQIAGRYKIDQSDGLELIEDGLVIGAADTTNHKIAFGGPNHRMVINSRTMAGTYLAGVKIENFMLWKDKFLSDDECLALRDNGYWWLCMTEEPAFWYYMDMLHSSGDILDRSSNQRNLTTTFGDLHDFPYINNSNATEFMQTSGYPRDVGAPALNLVIDDEWNEIPSETVEPGDIIRFFDPGGYAPPYSDPEQYIVSTVTGHERPEGGFYASVSLQPTLKVAQPDKPDDEGLEVKIYKQPDHSAARPPMPGVSYMTPDPNMGVLFKTYATFTPDPPPADFVDITTPVTNIPGQQQQYDVDGLEDGVPYEFRVRAVDQSGNESENTPPVEAEPTNPVFVLAEAVPWRTSRFFTKYKYTQQDFSKSRTS